MKKFDIHRWWIPGKPMWGFFTLVVVLTLGLILISEDALSARMLRALSAAGLKMVDGKVFAYGGVHPAGTMASVNDIIRGTFQTFWLVLIVCLDRIGISYRGLRRDNSIYIMKRVPAKETFRRCAVIPLLTALAVLILMLVLVQLFRARYMAIIPPEAMPPAEPFRPFYAFIPRSWNPWEMFRLYY